MCRQRSGAQRSIASYNRRVPFGPSLRRRRPRHCRLLARCVLLALSAPATKNPGERERERERERETERERVCVCAKLQKSLIPQLLGPLSPHPLCSAQVRVRMAAQSPIGFFDLDGTYPENTSSSPTTRLRGSLSPSPPISSFGTAHQSARIVNATGAAARQ